MQTLRAAVLMLALVILTALHVHAQTGKIDDDLQRAQTILNELAVGGTDTGMRDALEAELDRIEAHEYVVPVKLTARAYTSGSGYFPVTVSKAGLLEPPLVGRIEMPRSKPRRAKSKRNAAYATVMVRTTHGTTHTATKTIASLWVRVDRDVWTVSSEDTRLQAVALEPPITPADAQTIEQESDVTRIPATSTFKSEAPKTFGYFKF